MAKLPLNPEVNAIRNITFSETKEKDHEIKQEMISILKEKTGYKKDKETSETKRERRKKIRELAKDQLEKLQQRKDVLYTQEEKQGSKESKEKLPETAQSKKRDTMLSYAQENDQKHAERIEGRLGTINELRAKGIISDSLEGVNVKGLGKFASTETHNKVLEENFGNKVYKPFDWENHAGNNSKLDTVRKDDLNKKMKKGLVGNYKLGSKTFIDNTIFPWIEQKFEGVKNQEDKLYILQLINPDLFTLLWLDNIDSTGHFRQRVRLIRNVSNRDFDGDDGDDSEGGLFLVGNA